MSSRADFDTAAFNRALAQRFANMKRNAEREELRLAQITADEMRATVPRDTGRTSETIRARHTGQGAEIVMGGASLYLEFGTSHMSPRSFARPALAAAPGRFKPPSWH